MRHPQRGVGRVVRVRVARQRARQEVVEARRVRAIRQEIEQGLDGVGEEWRPDWRTGLNVGDDVARVFCQLAGNQDRRPRQTRPARVAAIPAFKADFERARAAGFTNKYPGGVLKALTLDQVDEVLTAISELIDVEAGGG